MFVKRIVGACLFIFSLQALSSCLIGNNCVEEVRKYDTEQEVYGVIEECYFGMNSRDRGSPVIILNGGKTKLVAPLATLVCYATKGDTLIKKKGTLLYLVKRGDKIKGFNPDCGRITVLDSGRTQPNPFFTYDCGKEKYDD